MEHLVVDGWSRPGLVPDGEDTAVVVAIAVWETVGVLGVRGSMRGL